MARRRIPIAVAAFAYWLSLEEPVKADDISLVTINGSGAYFLGHSAVNSVSGATLILNNGTVSLTVEKDDFNVTFLSDLDSQPDAEHYPMLINEVVTTAPDFSIRKMIAVDECNMVTNTAATVFYSIKCLAMTEFGPAKLEFVGSDIPATIKFMPERPRRKR